jgi:hypothetical protein
MSDGGCSLGFPLKALKRDWIAGHVLGQELQRNITFQLQVFGAVNHAHAAIAELLNNAVVRNDLVQHCPCKFNFRLAQQRILGRVPIKGVDLVQADAALDKRRTIRGEAGPTA